MFSFRKLIKCFEFNQLVPTEISPPKKQPTPPRNDSEKSPSPEKENTSMMPLEPVAEPESELEPVMEPTEPVTEATEPDPEPMAEETNEEELTTEEKDHVDGWKEPVITCEEQEEPKNNSHGNDFENDDDSQGQNIVQDFISRTVQDLSHDDSEDIQG